MSWIAGVLDKDTKETQDRIARKEGFDPGMVKEIGYSNDKITTEKLGSSERYGYRAMQGKSSGKCPNMCNSLIIR